MQDTVAGRGVSVMSGNALNMNEQRVVCYDYRLPLMERSLCRAYGAV